MNRSRMRVVGSLAIVAALGLFLLFGRSGTSTPAITPDADSVSRATPGAVPPSPSSITAPSQGDEEAVPLHPAVPTAVPARKPVPVVPQPATSPPAIPDALKTQRVTLSFQNEPLRNVIMELATKAKLNLTMSPRVTNTPVTIDVHDLEVASVLTELGTGRFRWVAEDYGVVRILPLEDGSTPGPR